MTNLYEITENYLQAFETIKIDPDTGELCGMDKLEELGGQLQDKLEATACYIKNTRALIDDIKAEEEALAKRRKAHESRILWLADYLANNLTAAGYGEFETPKCRCSFRKSTVVQITDETKLPTEYIKVVETRRPDKTALGKALKAGAEIPGAELIVNQNLQIK